MKAVQLNSPVKILLESVFNSFEWFVIFVLTSESLLFEIRLRHYIKFRVVEHQLSSMLWLLANKAAALVRESLFLLLLFIRHLMKNDVRAKRPITKKLMIPGLVKPTREPFLHVSHGI